MQKCTIEIRGDEIKGNITNDDALFFASLFYDETEKIMERDGKGMEAFSRMSDRFATKIGDDPNSDEATKILMANLAMQVQNIISKDFSIRLITAQRIRECFPDMDTSLVYVNSDTNFGIRLEIEELFSIIDTAMRVAFETLKKDGKRKTPKLSSFATLADKTGKGKIVDTLVVPEADLSEDESSPDNTEEIEDIDKQIAKLQKKKGQLVNK